jgi:hypothetical protein
MLPMDGAYNTLNSKSKAMGKIRYPYFLQNSLKMRDFDYARISNYRRSEVDSGLEAVTQ